MKSEYWYHGYLRTVKTRFENELRLSMARYARLEKQHHPCLSAQGKAIDFQRRVLEMIRDELAATEKEKL